MVWGEALLKAYVLEDNVAIYPRILFDTNTVYEISKDAGLSEFLLQDFDNMYFLNYLCIQHFGGYFLHEGFNIM